MSELTKTILFLSLAALALTACTETSKRVRFDGDYYRGRARAVMPDRHDFVASVGPVRQGLNGAREAARYEGTLYCISRFGTSDIDWQVHPVDAPATALTIEGDRLVAAGTCKEWP